MMFVVMRVQVNFDGRFVFLEGGKRPPGLLPLVEILVSRVFVAFVGIRCRFDEGTDFLFSSLLGFTCAFSRLHLLLQFSRSRYLRHS